jgi:S1-C subfamily serine protease
MRRAVAAAAEGIAAVVTESGAWATAVLVSARFLVTNAHLIEEHSRVRVQLWPGRAAGAVQPRWGTARVVYAFQGPLDLAVLQLEDKLCRAQALQLCAGPSVSPGQPVAVLGFPLFAPRSGLGPCATAGIAAKVVHHGGVPAMLMTTATVHQGRLLGLSVHACTGFDSADCTVVCSRC